MSYGIIRIQKMTAGSCKGIEIHDRREKEGISHTNKDIDWERTKNNYDLLEQEKSFYRAVQNRISELELNRAVRKDAIVMAQALITSDHEFFENKTLEEQRTFFEDSLKFIEERYGKENLISATVHMDERTPHMHVNFVPVTEDGRLSAKTLFSKKSLSELQDHFHDRVGRSYGLERGERGSAARHLEVIEYKIAQKTVEAAELTSKAAEISKSVELGQDRVKQLDAKITANLEVIDHIKHLPQGKKTLLGKIELTQTEYEALRDTAKAYYRAHQRAEEMTKTANQLYKSTSYETLEHLRSRNSELEEENKGLKKDVQQLHEVQEKCKELENNLEWYRDFYDHQMLNIAERVDEKDKEWLFDAVIPKWSKGEVEKDLVKAIDILLHPKNKVKELGRELSL